MTPHLSDEGLGSGWTHEQHSAAQRVPVAMELFHPHCSEQTGDHHVDVGLHLLEGDIHPLLGSSVEEILDTTDI